MNDPIRFGDRPWSSELYELAFDDAEMELARKASRRRVWNAGSRSGRRVPAAASGQSGFPGKRPRRWRSRYGDLPIDPIDAGAGPWQPDQDPPDVGESPKGAERVRWIQSSLNGALGLTLPVTGVLNAATRSAVRSFQQKQGLPVDGIVGPPTEQALAAANAQRAAPSVDATGDGSAAELELASLELASLELAPSSCGCPGCRQGRPCISRRPSAMPCPHCGRV
jgi:hypothetical protein